MSFKRILTAAVGIPLMYLLVQHAPPVYFFIFIAAGVLVGLYEFYRMFKNSGYQPQTLLGMTTGLMVVAGFYIGSVTESEIAYVFSPDVMVAFAFVAALLFRLFSARESGGAMVDVALTFTGVIYVAWLSAYFILLRDWRVGGIDGRDLVFFLMVVTWATDTGAYYTGTLAGKHKLYPKISPKKSWEGAFGGLALAVAAAVGCKYWFYHELPLHDAVTLGVVLGIVGQVGDLAESMIKRSARIKDSGGIFPGHGGYLDRVDSLLLNAPALYYYTLVAVSSSRGF
ncbi:MAG TPA: phosphatidate cytidylyltransferase [Nitrospirota bacterium]|nr:phosphatidate cytidylyltransferase [Nitrospirota bacterium]